MFNEATFREKYLPSSRNANDYIANITENMRTLTETMELAKKKKSDFCTFVQSQHIVI